MNVSVVVPRRADGGERDLIWAYTAPRWDRWPLVEGRHDREEGPFSRSVAINRGVRALGPWDVVVIADADVVVDHEQVCAAVDNAARTGRATLAFDTYHGLGRRMTAKVLAGYDGDWTPGIEVRMTDHVSSCIAVPRALWNQVGGFCESFVGWGWEDGAFIRACRVLGGGIDRVPGPVWHLHHAPSPERDVRSPDHAMGKALLQRYRETVTAPAMRRLVFEAHIDGILLVVMTDGRRECLDRLEEALDMISGPIMRVIIHDDSGDEDYQAWIRNRFRLDEPETEAWTLVCGPRRLGYAGAMTRARTVALQSGQRHVFFLEDDHELLKPVDLPAMRAILDANKRLAQLALLRQPWFPAELEAGGVLERFGPGAFTDREGWLEHQQFWTQNPMLMPRRVLVEPWPHRQGSEAMFGRHLVAKGWAFGYMGALGDPPVVEHFGQRSGHGH